MKANYADRILQKLEQEAIILGEDGPFRESRYIKVDERGRNIQQPRWRISYKWIEFECGCRGERVTKLFNPLPSDPIIFQGLPEQAVYEGVCSKHEAKMNDRVRLGGNRTFADWKLRRRNLLMGK
jgi:hypothetical protein